MQDLSTIGRGAEMSQRDWRLIEAVLPAVQGKHRAEPELLLNGLAYYKTDDIVAAIAYLGEYDARKAIEKAAEA